MAESLIVKTKRDGTLTFSDLAAANSYTVSFEAGDLNLTIPGATVNNFLDRGRFPAGNPAIRYGDDQPLTGTFTAYLRDISDAVDVTLTEILLQSGAVASGWTSTMGVNGEVFALKLTWTIAGVIHGDASDHVLELDHCYVTGSLGEGDPDTVTINFTSYTSYPVVT
jgi:hypothetical protein